VLALVTDLTGDEIEQLAAPAGLTEDERQSAMARLEDK